VPQRKKDLRLARQLMDAAGFSKGFSITLTTERVGEIPQLAQIIQQSVRQIGIKMTLKILTSTAYFAGSQTGPPSGWGATPWLNAPMTITDWGNRAVPNVFLTAALKSKGVWSSTPPRRRCTGTRSARSASSTSAGPHSHEPGASAVVSGRRRAPQPCRRA
jgi:peptide/nickel transport system substrate-binding protein